MGALDFDNYITPVNEPSPEDLGNGRGCNRRSVELNHYLVEFMPCFLLDDPDRIFSGKRRDPVLKLFELICVSAGDQIRTGGEYLGKFDEARSEF